MTPFPQGTPEADLFAAMIADDAAGVRRALDAGARCDVADALYGVDAVGLTELVGGDSVRILVLEHALDGHLMAAAYLGDAAAVARRIEAGDDPSPLLFHALQLGDEGLARAMRAVGGTLTLGQALQVDSLPELEVFLREGSPNAAAEIPVTLAGVGATRVACPLLHIASLADAQDCVERLFEAGADVDRWTAAGFGQLDELVAEDVDQLDPIGMTALHHAVFGHQVEAARWLLERGASVQVSHDSWPDGPRALHLAAGVDAPAELLALLVEAGASLDALTSAGTPLEVARHNEADSAAAWLAARSS